MLATRNSSRKFLLTIIIVGKFTFLVFYVSYQLLFYDKNHVKNIKSLCLKYKNNNETKYILYWTPFYGYWSYELGFGYEPFENCEYCNCYATQNRSLLPVNKFDALLFHLFDLAHKYKSDIPVFREPHQRYVLVNSEAPVYIGWNFISYLSDSSRYESYFNWTMNYRLDADINRSYGYTLEEKTNYSAPSREFLKNKKLAAWMVSHCYTASRREILVQEIQKFMSVDIYGACGDLKCIRKGPVSPPECYDMIEKKYKFYFSFENAYCKDYSTEKLYNILQKNVVPVVYGFCKYNVITPPNSVINVEHFKNVKELVDFLNYLDKNDEEYLKYFEWKKNYRVDTSFKVNACSLCKKLNEPMQKLVYHNLKEWFWGRNESVCMHGEQLPKIVTNILFKIQV